MLSIKTLYILELEKYILVRFSSLSGMYENTKLGSLPKTNETRFSGNTEPLVDTPLYSAFGFRSIALVA